MTILNESEKVEQRCAALGFLVEKMYNQIHRPHLPTVRWKPRNGRGFE